LLRATGHALDRLGHQPRPTAGEVALTRSAHILTGRPTHRLVRQPAPGGTLGRHQSPLRNVHPRRALTTWSGPAPLRIASAPAFVKIRFCADSGSDSKYECGSMTKPSSTASL